LIFLSACLACSLSAGCASKQKQRSTVAFHTKGVRLGIRRVRNEMEMVGRRKRKERVPGGDFYAMKTATDMLARALRGLPGRIQKKATTRVPERKAAAEKAAEVFRQLEPQLLSLQFDEAKKAKIEAGFAEIEQLLTEVETAESPG